VLAAEFPTRASQFMRESLRVPYPLLTKRLTGPELGAPIIRCLRAQRAHFEHDFRHQRHVRYVGGQFASEEHAVGRAEDVPPLRPAPVAGRVAVKRSAEQEPLVELLALVAIPGAPLVARDLPLAGQRFEGAKRIVEVRGRLFGVHPDQEAGPCRREVIS